MGGAGNERVCLTLQTLVFSEGAENNTRRRVCSPIFFEVPMGLELGT